VRISKRSVLFGLLLVVLSLPVLVVAQTLGSPPYGTNVGAGTLSAANPKVTFTDGPFFVPNLSQQVTSLTGLIGAGVNTPTCIALPSLPGNILNTNQCDFFNLTVNGSGAPANSVLQIIVTWPDPNNPADQSEFDLLVYDSAGNVVGTAFSGNSTPRRVTLQIPPDGTQFVVQVVPFNPQGFSYTATASFVPKPAVPPVPPPNPQAARFQTYLSPAGLGDNAGEPSIGIDQVVKVPSLRHGTVNQGGVTFFQSGPNTLRVSFDDVSSPAGHLWEDVSTPLVQQFVLSDPIGHVDPSTGRVFSLDLIGFEGNSFMAFSDDDGQTWTPAQGGGIPGAPDHETLGSGPYASPLPNPGPVYPHAVYYCGQDIAPEAQCSRSDDGGATFGPGVPIYQTGQCAANGSIHGHVKVGPDGAVYVPSGSCSAGPGLAYSRDNGLTWSFSAIPSSTDAANLDPSIAIDSAGTLYFIWLDGNTHQPWVAVSHDGAQTWGAPFNVGAAFSIENANFVVATAGDPGRAAVGFVGTTTAGDSTQPGFRGAWDLYVATTYDSGNTWTTVDTTPGDPVQLGCIWTGGGSNPCRNLLDFNDMHIDSQGRVEVAFAKGCLESANCTPASLTAHGPPYPESFANKAAIARQSGGMRMIAAFDPPAQTAPGAPRLRTAQIDPATGQAIVTWDAPDNGGSPITAYNIWRGTSPGGETLLTSIGAARTTFADSAVQANTTYYYQVTATNAVGTSAKAGELVAVPAPPAGNPCKLPGVAVGTSPAGNQRGAPANAGLDIVSVSVGEPFPSPAGTSSIVLTIQVSNLAQTPTLPPNAEWKIGFAAPDDKGTLRSVFFEGDTNDATRPNGEFSYGYTGGTTDFGQGDSPAVTGTFDTKASQIVIVIDTSHPIAFQPGIGSADVPFTVTLGAGSVLNGFFGQTVLLIGAQPAGIGGGLLETVDQTSNGSYTLKGNAFCRPDGPVIAVVQATPNTVQCSPATVTLDGSQSFDASGDAIASYTFDPGDGTAPVTTSAASVSHTYTQGGSFSASLQVACTRGMKSTNGAHAAVTVGGTATPTITAPATVNSGQGGYVASAARHAGSTYAWSITNGKITKSQGTSSIKFAAGSRGTLTLRVVETNNGCASPSGSTTVTVQ